MKILIVDNYDSFTYNLYQYIGEAASERGKTGATTIKVIRNDEWSFDEIKAFEPDRIVISPGPGSPDDPAYFGVSMQCIKELGPSIPLLGVCLGMQGIACAFGGKVVKARVPMHGKVSPIAHDGSVIFDGIPQAVEIMRYHSLVACTKTLPSCLRITASTQVTAVQGTSPADVASKKFDQSLGNGEELMAIQHREYPIYGIQFHPESFGSEGGKDMLANFLYHSCIPA